MEGSDYHGGRGSLHLSCLSASDNAAAEGGIDTAVLTTIAHLLGGQMARNAFERLSAVNNDTPVTGTGKDQEI